MTSDGSELAPAAPRYSRGAHWVAIFAAAFTWPLIFVGGSVTTYRVGMAVPDWPTTFGINMFLYDFWNAPFGVKVEHTHRLYGSAVGLATIVLAVWFFAAERRRTLKVLGVVALAAVIIQGVLGGYRVRHNSTLLAAVHGVTGQAFFALMVSLCVLTGRDWIETTVRRIDPGKLRRRTRATLIMVAAQVVIGAWLRHFSSVPALLIHALVALAVWGHATMVALGIESRKGELPALVPAARTLAGLVFFQIALGIEAWLTLQPFDGHPKTVTILQAMIRTGHQANGALILAAAVVLAMRAVRHLAPANRAAHDPGNSLDLEAVA